MSEPNDEQLLIDGHEYDGIQELDNALPTWWLYLFYLTVAFGCAYLVYFHVLKDGSSAAAYAAEVAAAPTPAVAEIAPAANPEEVAAVDGGKIFMTNCMPCHGPDGRGVIGPNLTDDNSIHGCSKEEVVKIITVGVPLKGMISWAPVLKPAEIEAVAEYILTLRGTTPESPKPPEGEICK